MIGASVRASWSPTASVNVVRVNQRTDGEVGDRKAMPDTMSGIA